MRILLVEDDAHDIEAVLRSLGSGRLSHRAGITVVHDGSQALAHLFAQGPHGVVAENSHRPHLIVLDLKLPSVDGLEVLRRVKEDPRTRLIPVVVLTGSREAEHVEECYRLGVNSYVVKPIDAEKFASVLETVGNYWVLFNEPPSL